MPALAMQASSQATTSAGGSAVQSNAERGKVLYQNCTSCHSIDENDVGPKHRGVLGRRAGTVADYAYSPALKTATSTRAES